MKVSKVPSQYELQKMLVAAYARVSTEAEEQMQSFDAQVRYYTNLIQKNSQWEFCGVYADPGISGTSAEHRPEFQRMITDAVAGKIEIVLVKSISRFARNVVDAQNYVKELKGHGVEVRFEREGISSFDTSSDMVFNLLAAVAQEESRSISEHTKWSYRKNAEKGIRHIGCNRVLGYDEINGELIPNNDAWIVKLAFELYANGTPLSVIVNNLKDAGAIGLRSGKPLSADAILRMVGNELYVGDRIIQKQAPVNYLTKKPDPTVAFEQYYITDDHAAIVDRITWVKAKERHKNSKEQLARGIHARCSSHFLYGKVFCGECGAPYKRRSIKKKNGETYFYWNCTRRQLGNGCLGRNIKESELLDGIADELGWAEFSKSRFLLAVDHVEIKNDRITAVKSTGPKHIFYQQ